MAGNTNFDALLTTTVHNYVSNKLEDNIFSATNTLKALKAKGGVTTKGGDVLLMPLMYAKNNTVKTMTPYGVFDTTPSEGISAAEYQWANIGGTVVLDNFTIQVKNAGESKVIDLLDAKIKQLELSLTDVINGQVFSTGRTGAYELWSLYDLCAVGGADDNFVDPSYTGDGTGFGRIPIASSQNTWWRPARYYDDGTAGPSTAAGALPVADDAISLANLRHIYYVCSNGNDTPDLIVTTMQAYEAIQKLLIDTNRSGPDQALYDAGIEHIRLNNASIIFEPALVGGPTGNEIFFLNTKYVKLVTCSDRDMQSTPFQTPHNQDVRVSKIVWSGQLACSNRARQGIWIDADVS